MADGLFRQFLHTLRPHSFCVSCLGRMYDQPDHVIREALQPLGLGGGLESRVGECRGCAGETSIYRLP